MQLRKCATTVDNMASKGLRAISYQGTLKVEADNHLSHISETLIGYIVCYLLAFFNLEINKITQNYYLSQNHCPRFLPKSTAFQKDLKKSLNRFLVTFSILPFVCSVSISVLLFLSSIFYFFNVILFFTGILLS